MRTLLLALLAPAALSAGPLDLDLPPIRYGTTAPTDPVAHLQRTVHTGKTVLSTDDSHGYLGAVLKELDVPLSSQVLVFSRTSLQRGRISPKTPRAIYFNDDITVGYCHRGDVLEIASSDAQLGTVFYTVDQDPQVRKPIVRQTERCLLCHGSSSTQGIPGHLIRSVFPDRTAEPVFARGTRRVDHSTPFSERWGGWYVTGTSGKQTHLGNKIYGRGLDPKPTDGVNITDLKTYFTIGNYLTSHSDLVALMVLEHQCEGHNRLARANLLTRMALAEQAGINKALELPPDEPIEGITRRIGWVCESVVEYLLFADEAPLEEAIAGTSRFAKDFAARGPFDSKGRTLRTFDLRTRLFKTPLSYLIYSRAFEGLPPQAKARVYQRLWEVVSGKDRSKPFAHLSDEDRKTIREIVFDTKKNLPVYWKK
jgi:hypothetical protein